MKQQWQAMAQKVDSLTLRERVIIFTMIVVALVATVNQTMLDPRFARQKQLVAQIKSDQSRLAQMQAEVAQAVAARNVPDNNSRARLAALKQQLADMQSALQTTQRSLVSPDKMATLLEDLLKRDGILRVVSVKTLPAGAGSIAANMAAAGDKPDSAAAPGQVAAPRATSGPVFTHGVEVVVQGSYLDMLQYMTELENMPWQFLWGRAKLNIEEYPKATLTLTLFTLSLDKKWLNL